MLLDLDVRLARLEVHRTLLFPQGQLASNVGALMEALGQLQAPRLAPDLHDADEWAERLVCPLQDAGLLVDVDGGAKVRLGVLVVGVGRLDGANVEVDLGSLGRIAFRNHFQQQVRVRYEVRVVLKPVRRPGEAIQGQQLAIRLLQGRARSSWS